MESCLFFLSQPSSRKASHLFLNINPFAPCCIFQLHFFHFLPPSTCFCIFLSDVYVSVVTNPEISLIYSLTAVSRAQPKVSVFLMAHSSTGFRMRLGLTLSLVSSFQIFQQSVINELHDIDRKDLVFSIASAAFPLGSFCFEHGSQCYSYSNVSMQKSIMILFECRFQ